MSPPPTPSRSQSPESPKRSDKPTEEKPLTLASLDDYDSADDSDFDPSSAPAPDDAALSDSDSDADSDAPRSPRQNKRRKLSAGDFEPVEPLIKTRSQRAAETRVKCGGVAEGKVTTNVDALWAAMSSAPVVRPPAANTVQTPPATADPERKAREEAEAAAAKAAGESKNGEVKVLVNEMGEKMVEIEHTYEFAGKTITEKKLVPASSQTALAHASVKPPPEGAPKRRAPPKRRASAFDTAAAARAKPSAPVKLNTLEKSRLDWAGFVDGEGIGDELKKWNKGDKGYLDRQAFLGRVEQKRDEAWKAAKKM